MSQGPQWVPGSTIGHIDFNRTTIGPGVHNGSTMGSQWVHNGSTMGPQWVPETTMGSKLVSGTTIWVSGTTMGAQSVPWITMDPRNQMGPGDGDRNGSTMGP